MRTRIFTALLILVALARGDARAADQSNQALSTLVAGLQRLQDQAAAGDAAAFQAQPAALKSIAAAIDSSSPDVWKDSRERVAAAVYLLSGGAPGPLVRRLPGDMLSSEDGALLRAALAYATGRRQEATQLFDRFDLSTMDKRLAGQFAYALAELVSEEDDVKALNTFDLARLLSPGGLVEEASLRREVRILGAKRDFDRFSFLSEQYIRRFPHSAYYNDFSQFFYTVLERMVPDDRDSGAAEKYLALVNALPASDRRRMLLTVARAAMLNAHSQIAIAFARAVMQDASAEAADKARAQLYEDAARVLTKDYAEAAKDLQTVATERLDRENSDLLAAVRKVAQDAGREPTVPRELNEPLQDNATIKSAEEALQRTNSLVAQTAGASR